MKRTQVQIDETTYELLRARAFQRGVSVSALLREAARKYLSEDIDRPRRRLADFTFIGSGRSEESDLDPISENHDEAFVESILKR